MKLTLLTALAFLFVNFALSSYADEGDSLTKKAVKATIVKDADDDSAVKKGAKLKATSNIITDENDSTLKKATKLKVLKEASE